MRYKLAFVKTLWIYDHSFKEIEEEGVYSKNDGKNMIVVTIQSQGASYKLRLIDIVVQL